MFRQTILALGVLAFALVGSSRAAKAQDHVEPPHGEAAASAPHGAAPHAAEPNILELKPSLAFATLIVFLVLMGVLTKYAWGPLAKALADRERSQEELVAKAEHAREESERLLAEHRAQMALAADQARSILDEARRAGQSTADDIVKKAQAEAEASRDRAKREIETAKDQALMEIWTKAADLSVSVAGKVLSRELNEGEQRRLVEVAMSELPAHPNGSGGRRA